MDKKIQIIAIVGAMAFSAFVLTSPSDPITLPKPTSNSESDFVSILAENLDNPRAIAVSDNRIFVTEKDGRIRVFSLQSSKYLLKGDSLYKRNLEISLPSDSLFLLMGI